MAHLYKIPSNPDFDWNRIGLSFGTRNKNVDEQMKSKTMAKIPTGATVTILKFDWLKIGWVFGKTCVVKLGGKRFRIVTWPDNQMGIMQLEHK